MSETAARVAAALGRRAVTARPVSGGYTRAERLVVELDDGRSVFAKSSGEPLLAGWIRDEHRFYAEVEAEFVPQLVAFLADDPPVLVLEDLSRGFWPPPWPEGTVARVLEALARVRATPAPGWLQTIDVYREELTDGWPRVARDPAAFLSLGLASREWFDECLPTLAASAESAPFEGTDLLHFDVRSDNLCLHGERVLLVDWNWPCAGNGLLDVAAWLPSLHAEGGPPPEDVLPHSPPGFAAVLAGFWAARAALPPPDTALSHVREVQLRQLRVALPWAARALGLPEPR